MEKKHIVITAGSAYTDIDVLACAIGYQECLSFNNVNVQAILRAPFNESICKSIMEWDCPYTTKIPSNPHACDYILVDVSDPRYMESFVVPENIIQVLDHHYGFEDYWLNTLGCWGIVEKVGACATLVWEQFKKNAVETKIGDLSANLLYTAIFANTVNMQSKVTTKRDIVALEEIEPYTRLPQKWIQQYYREVSQSILADPINAILKDTKHMTIAEEVFVISQLELWDAKPLFENVDLIAPVRRELGTGFEKYLLLVTEASKGKTSIISEDKEVQQLLSNCLNVKFQKNNFTTADRVWMRKEVIRELQKVAGRMYV